MTQEEISQLPPNVITRALGIREEVQVDMIREEAQAGDVYLLCSDGLTGMLSDADILAIVQQHALSGPLEPACELLVERANDAGGDDNITVTLARLDP